MDTNNYQRLTNQINTYANQQNDLRPERSI